MTSFYIKCNNWLKWVKQKPLNWDVKLLPKLNLLSANITKWSSTLNSLAITDELFGCVWLLCGVGAFEHSLSWWSLWVIPHFEFLQGRSFRGFIVCKACCGSIYNAYCIMHNWTKLFCILVKHISDISIVVSTSRCKC